MKGGPEEGHDGARVERSLDISKSHVSWTTDREQPLVRVLTFNGTALEEAGRLPALHSLLILTGSSAT